MNSESLSLAIGAIGAIATIGCLFFAWRNDQLFRLIPKDKEVAAVFEENVNKEGFIQKVHAVLQRKVTDRKKLRSALAIAKQMHFAKPMDEALIEINNRALELGDIKFAYHVATNAYFAVSLDQMLMNVVDAALGQDNPKFANRAASRMHFAINLDEAKKKIMASYGVKPNEA